MTLEIAATEFVDAAATRFADRRLGPATVTRLAAAITSCTNTSSPSVMLAAGLLARKAKARL